MVAAGRPWSEVFGEQEVGDCSTYRSEIINEDTPLMDGQSNCGQSDGIVVPDARSVVTDVFVNASSLQTCGS